MAGIFGVSGLACRPKGSSIGEVVENKAELKIELEREEDGRWLGEIPAL